MKIIIIFTMILVAVAFIPTSATIINVPDDYETIQEGIDASSDGDTVLVQPGAYVENINFNGHNITLGSLFLTTGDTSYISATIIDGDSSGSVVTFESGEDSAAVITGFTIQNGYTELAGGGINCYYSSPTINNNIIYENSAYSFGGGICCTDANSTIINNSIVGNSVEFFGGGISCIRSNLTISNNTINDNISSHFGGGINCGDCNPIISNNIISENFSNGNGGGINCKNNSNPLIINNTIDCNSSEFMGGGIFCENSNPTVNSNTISGNSGLWGGGIYCDYGSNLTIIGNFIGGNTANLGSGGIHCRASSPIINNNTISENFTNSSGGGIRLDYGSNPEIINNTIRGNYAQYDGGGIYCFESDPMLSYSSINTNSAYDGGGIYCDYNSNPTIINSVIVGNTAVGSGGIVCRENSNPIITNIICWVNSIPEIYIDYTSLPTITYCDIQDGCEGEGNIDVDPLFRDPENGDFHLMTTYCGDPYDSPCIDAGHPNIIDSLLDCDWGLGELRSDMGAYGGGDSVEVDIDDQSPHIPNRFALAQNCPNPFNAFTTIKYNLPKETDVTIDIYDIIGRKVETLVDKQQPAGYHHVVWDANDKSSGMYFYRIKTGDYTETKKMLLLK